ncbi:DUF3102 domain-containing protein [Mesorhizobium sp. M0933]|uniref:DUF3102 domain-containing protein n=1 Tax=Mesorhizobium sp. M0933 TaxID=2957030 RepID=UPI00333833F0
MTNLQLDDAIDELVLDAIDAIEIPDTKPTPVAAVNIQPVLDGEVIVPATAAELADAADRIHKLVSGIGDSMFEVGKELVAIKARLEHGEFGKWVKASLTMTERTAQRYMSVVEKFDGDKYDTVSVLPVTLIQKLAAPTVPDVLRDQVLAEIGAGNTPDPSNILFRIADAKDKQEKAKAEADMIARKTGGKTPEQAAKITTRIKADKASRIAAETAKRATYEQERKDSEQAAADAVALLRQHLGADFAKFRKLLNTAGYFFGQAMQKAASVKAGNVELRSDAA